MKTVLVVDDDPDIRSLITWKLAQAGYATMSASDGEEGLAAVVSGGMAGLPGPDLIVIDWMMPRVTGVEVCRALRANPLTAHIPIILLTAKAQEAEIEFGYAGGHRRLHREAIQSPCPVEPGQGGVGPARSPG